LTKSAGYDIITVLRMMKRLPMIDMNVNAFIRDLTDEARTNQVELLYDQMMEDMYGSNPFWDGPGDGWDWNDGLMYWERK
jgi:hypothetical protein